MFWRPKDTMKAKPYFFSGYKQRKNVSLMYLKCKLQQHRYGCCILKLKSKKKAEEHIQREENHKEGIAYIFRC